MKNFPAICIDNFYSDPDRIREFALAQTYLPSPEGRWPGKRTICLSKIDRNFFDLFCHKLFSIYYDLDKTNLRWEVLTTFQLIPTLDPNADSVRNKGWIHTDDSNIVFAGIIYLSPDIDLNCGTSLFNLTNQKKLSNDNWSRSKEKFYSQGIANEHHDHFLQENRDSYTETTRFNNVYNRLIAFDADTAHGVNSYYTGELVRLTQVFFVYKVESDSPSPLSRHRKFL